MFKKKKDEVKEEGTWILKVVLIEKDGKQYYKGYYNPLFDYSVIEEVAMAIPEMFVEDKKKRR